MHLGSCGSTWCESTWCGSADPCKPTCFQYSEFPAWLFYVFQFFEYQASMCIKESRVMYNIAFKMWIMITSLHINNMNMNKILAFSL
ncbi:hypothetical protein Hanom_Chr13g01231871 [Helianthus anomalus]